MSKFQSHLFILSFLFILISGCSSIFNHSDSLVIPINSINPQPILGVWKGKYSCAQGITGVTLVLDQNDKNKKIIDGTFVFYPTRLNPQVPNGSLPSSIWSISFPREPRSRDFSTDLWTCDRVTQVIQDRLVWWSIPITKNPLANRSPDTVEDLHRSTPLHIQALREQEDLLRSFLQHSPFFLPETGYYLCIYQ